MLSRAREEITKARAGLGEWYARRPWEGWKGSPAQKWLIGGGAAALVVFVMIAVPSLQNSIKPRGIVIHHTGWIGQPLNRSSLDQFHENSGYRVFYWGRTYHIGYHYIIHPDGRIERGRPERAVGAHAKGHNDHLGIALIGNFSRKHNPDGRQGLAQPTRAQLNSLLKLTAGLRKKYEIPVQQVLIHKRVQATECPGDRFPDEVFYRLAAGPRGAAAR